MSPRPPATGPRAAAALARRAVLFAVAAALLAVAALRGAALAAGPATPGELLTALGERRWHAWAQRHPVMQPAFAAAAERVPAGERVAWVVPPAVQPRWVEIMALYHLPAAWPAAVRTRGAAAGGAEAGGAEAGWRVDVYADGRVQVRPRR
jgi:hypothetical protein